MGLWKRFLDWINHEGVTPDPLPDPEVVATITKKLLRSGNPNNGVDNMNEAGKYPGVFAQYLQSLQIDQTASR